jgi:hypothetical protein
VQGAARKISPNSNKIKPSLAKHEPKSFDKGELNKTQEDKLQKLISKLPSKDNTDKAAFAKILIDEAAKAALLGLS